MKAVFSERAFSAVLAETTEKVTTETGGLFLGTFQNDVWYIIETIDPGPKSIFEVAYFEYDQQYTQHLINKIANLYAQKLDLIGLWHRHPGSFDRFSTTDNGTNAKYAKMRPAGAISGLVNIDPEFRFTMYHVGQPCRYRVIEYEVGDHLIPAEFLQYKSQEKYFSLMKKLLQSESSDTTMENYKKSVSLDSFLGFIMPEIRDREYLADDEPEFCKTSDAEEKIINAVMSDLTFMSDSIGIQMTISLKDHQLIFEQEAIDQTTRICFGINASDEKILFLAKDKWYCYQEGLLENAANRAKAKREEKASSDQMIRDLQRTGNIFDSVVRLITHKRNEE